MSNINIPFMPKWKQKMLSRQKTATSRTHKYGMVGDNFEIFNHTFRITQISFISLELIAEYFYKQEGCDNPNEFIEIWKQIHPIMGWQPKRKVYIHLFHLEGE